MKRVISVWFVSILVLAGARPAHAQQATPAGEVAVGFAPLLDLTYETAAPGGWYVSPAINLNRWFSVVADIGGNYGDFTEHGFFGGARARYSWTRASIYLQVLGGAATCCGETNRAVQSGLGLDISMSPVLALRLESGGRVGPYRGETDARWRGVIGVVYRFGQRQ